MAKADVNLADLFVELNENSAYLDDANAANNRLKSIDCTENIPLTLKVNIEGDDTAFCKYLVGSSHCLLNVKENLEDVDLVKFKRALANFVRIGVKANLIPNAPQYLKSDLIKNEDILKQYNYLTIAVFSLTECFKDPTLRSFILLDEMQALLNGLYQLVYCPLKKPSDTSTTDASFSMTREFYDRVLGQRIVFGDCLQVIEDNMGRIEYVKETLVLLDKNQCKWFIKAVSVNLTQLLVAKDGIQNVTMALLQNSSGYDSSDTASSWKAFDLIFRLISSLVDSKDFENSICPQLIQLLSGDDKIFESIYIGCLKTLQKDGKAQMLIEALFQPFMEGYIDGEGIMRSVKILHLALIGRTLNMDNLPISTIKPKINLLFHRYNPKVEGGFARRLSEIICKLLKEDDTEEVYNEILFQKGDGDCVDKQCSEKLVTLCQRDSKLSIKLFLHLLKCLQDELEHGKGVEKFVRCEMIYHSLGALALDPIVVEKIHESPQEVVEFMGFTLRNFQRNKDEMVTRTILMLVKLLVESGGPVDYYQALLEPLQSISGMDVNDELRGSIKEVISILGKKGKGPGSKNQAVTPVEMAIREACDQHLPIRAHGLLALSKLVAIKDPEVFERRQFILTLFQESIKNEDSYIYLMAIQGLAAMGEVYPEEVLESLTDEYLEESGEVENRLKIGESLVKIVQKLGAKALEHKVILLNTFLAAVKDEDHLIRASSLSNLGEVCGVIAYDLGAILGDVLKCVHEVVIGDQAVEARRAGITVLRQLFQGLERDTLVVLEDHLSEIHQTLQDVYGNSADEVMKLQAQLALEQLNENVLLFLRAVQS